MSDSQYLEYVPGSRRMMGDPSPQTDPDRFRTEDLVKEIKYLIRLNKRHGSHPLRTAAYLRLESIVKERRNADTNAE